MMLMAVTDDKLSFVQSLEDLGRGIEVRWKWNADLCSPSGMTLIGRMGADFFIIFYPLKSAL